MKMILIFIDGLGLGEADKSKNPLAAAYTPFLDNILKGENAIPTDACLGVAGLPQSATGQTAIFTGVNAPRVLGRHLHGQPTVTLKNIITHNNLFKELIKRGFQVTNANVYRHEYLSKMLDPAERRYKPSVTSVMTMSCGMGFRSVDDYKEGNGLYHDIVGQVLIDSGYDVKLITPQDAARRLYAISRNYDFTLFEHFMSDIIGHKMDMDLAIKEVELLDAFLAELVALSDLKKDIILITSDHGNIEDVSVKTHTMNQVPTVILGKLPMDEPLEIKSLIDITPFVLKVMEKGRN